MLGEKSMYVNFSFDWVNSVLNLLKQVRRRSQASYEGNRERRIGTRFKVVLICAAYFASPGVIADSQNLGTFVLYRSTFSY